MLLLFDNYDSFTYNLKDYFEQLGETVMVIKNDELSIPEIQALPFDKLVLSPGPRTPSEAGLMMQVIDTFHKAVPILGVCLGHQALGLYFGASLHKSIRPMHGKVSAISHTGKGIYSGLSTPLDVCRYHSLILKDFENTQLEITAETAEAECMSFVHKSLSITGIQYHPEAILTTEGMTLLSNWLSSCK